MNLILQPLRTATLLALTLLVGLAVLGPAGSEARTVKVHASKLSKRSVTFRPHRLNPSSVRGATVRIKRHRRHISAKTARRAVAQGHLRVPVSHTSRRHRRKRHQYTLLVRARATRIASTGPTPTPAPTPTPTPAPDPTNMLIAPSRLSSLPTSGSAYAYMKDRADAALTGMNLSDRPDASSPWLPNYNGAGSVTRPGTQTLAAALVYARTGDSRYRDFVIRANRYLIGTEQEQSTDGTPDAAKLLATSRQIGAFVVAASLVNMDRNVTGSRNGWGTTSWRTWLADLRTKHIGSSGQAATMVEVSNERANNWGSFGRAARIAIDVYIGDEADLAKVVDRFKLSLGEGAGAWVADQDLDLTFSCLGSDWASVNPASCGPAKDGMIVEDISRSSSSFPRYDSTGIGYTMESYQAMLFSAILLQRQGYSAFSWGDQALRRVMDWLTREGVPQGNNSTVERHESWVAQYFYGKSYPTVPASMGRTLGFTDWLFGR